MWSDIKYVSTNWDKYLNLIIVFVLFFFWFISDITVTQRQHKTVPNENIVDNNIISNFSISLSFNGFYNIHHKVCKYLLPYINNHLKQIAINSDFQFHTGSSEVHVLNIHMNVYMNEYTIQ